MRGGEFTKCEACRVWPVEILRESSDPQWPYRLCSACAHRLRHYALRPLEWFHLTIIHGPHEYYLHDDFYSQEGEALQPKEPVGDVDQWAMPALTQGATLETLLDYAMAHFFLDEEDEIITLLRRRDQASLLALLQERMRVHPPVAIEGRVYEICAYASGYYAEAWIRACWKAYHPEVFDALALAAAFCLPLSEGFVHVRDALETMPAREMRTASFVLAFFHTAMTLDWLEDHVQPPITADWGRLAAVSQFSWERAVKWLDAGRPLSLVALDALKACTYYDTPYLRRYAPKLLGEVTEEEIKQNLEAYLLHDPAPRVKQALAVLFH